MRDFKGMKRQRGRNRSSGGGGGQGKPQQHNANRAFESNGPDNVKIRGNAQHVFEKYQQLARDAQSSGDRVLAENYLQHAEHYFRVIRAVQPNRAAADIIGRDAFTSGIDIDFEDESGAQADPEPTEAEASEEGGERQFQQGQRQDRYEGRRDDRQRDDRPRDDRPRDERPRDERPRDERPRDDRPRDDRPRDERPRDDRPRDRSRDERQGQGRSFNRDDRRDRFRDERPADPMAVVEPQAQPFVAPAPEPAAASPVLRSEDGGVSHAPAFLQAREPRPEPAAEEGEAKPRPRRRRTPRSFEGGSDAPAKAEEV